MTFYSALVKKNTTGFFFCFLLQQRDKFAEGLETLLFVFAGQKTPRKQPKKKNAENLALFYSSVVCRSTAQPSRVQYKAFDGSWVGHGAGLSARIVVFVSFGCDDHGTLLQSSPHQ